MVKKSAIIMGTFIVLAISSVSIGLISDNDFSPVGNFLAIAGVGTVPAVVIYLGGEYSVGYRKKAVWTGINVFAFVMAAYMGLTIYQRPYEIEGNLPIYAALGFAVLAAIVIGLISFVHGRKAEKE